MSTVRKISKQAKWLRTHSWYNKVYRQQNKKRLNKLQNKRYKKNRRKLIELRRQVRNRNLDLIAQFKHTPCKDCNRRYDPFIMHFDHRDPSKKFKSVSQMTSYSVQNLLPEISKCDVVCANCHGLRTKEGIQNGTISLFGWKYTN